MQKWRMSRRDAMAVAAGLAAPVALAAALADQVGAALASSHPVGR
jgi:hypothetical protein